MSERQLFDKSMDELREAFVRARFAEKKVFGRADIEEWLAEQKTKEDISPTWPNLHSLIFQNWRNLPGSKLGDAHIIETLRANATPGKAPLGKDSRVLQMQTDKVVETLTKFISCLSAEKNVSVYLGYLEAMVVMEPDDEKDVDCFIITPRHETLRITKFQGETPLITETVFNILLSEWQYRGSKWKMARDFCCRGFQYTINAVRSSAQNDFDRAVAISADGAKIVHADEVVVVVTNPTDKKRKLLSFPATAFAQNKILRAAEMQRDVATFRTIQNIYLNIINDPAFFLGGVPQTLFDSRSATKPRVFVTEEKFCPSPLPDGGVELK